MKLKSTGFIFLFFLFFNITLIADNNLEKIEKAFINDTPAKFKSTLNSFEPEDNEQILCQCFLCDVGTIPQGSELLRQPQHFHRQGLACFPWLKVVLSIQYANFYDAKSLDIRIFASYFLRL